ncbi:hypothetical protein [Spirosoma gilvum]
MRQRLLILAMVMVTITGLFFYCQAAIDWVQDLRSGVYDANPEEAILETAALSFYTFGGLFFFKWKFIH